MTDPISRQVSLLADAGLLLPVSVWLAAWVASSDLRLSVRWILAMGGLFALVATSKLVWALWHVEIPVLHFRMFSGHMALAYSIWPTAGALLVGAFGSQRERSIRVFVYLACACIGVSRLVGAHTPSEIVAGSLLGLSIDRHFAKRMRAAAPRLRWRAVFAVMFIASVCYAYGSPIYSVGWFDRMAARMHR